MKLVLCFSLHYKHINFSIPFCGFSHITEQQNTVHCPVVTILTHHITDISWPRINFALWSTIPIRFSIPGLHSGQHS